MEQTLTIDGIYNGATGVANGGYSCGVVASFISGDAEVRLNAAFPTETPLTVKSSAEGNVEFFLEQNCSKTTLLGSGKPTLLDLEVPNPPNYEAARQASENFIFLHRVDPRGCYVCSPIRPAGEGLRLFIGPLPNIQGKSMGENLVASVWRPSPEQAKADGYIDPVYIWSVLDCPGVTALKLRNPGSGVLVLGSCAASMKEKLPASEHYVVSAWEIDPPQGAKRFMGVAIHSRTGKLMACARQVCFDVGDAVPGSRSKS